MKQKCSNPACFAGEIFKSTFDQIVCSTCKGTGFIEVPEQNAIAEISGETGVEILNILYINALRHLSNDEMKLLADNLYSKISKPEPQHAIPTDDGYYWVIPIRDDSKPILAELHSEWHWKTRHGSKWCNQEQATDFFTSIHPVKITPPTDGWIKL